MTCGRGKGGHGQPVCQLIGSRSSQARQPGKVGSVIELQGQISHVGGRSDRPGEVEEEEGRERIQKEGKEGTEEERGVEGKGEATIEEGEMGRASHDNLQNKNV